MHTNNSEISTNNHLGYMRIKQVLELIPIGRSTWWLWVSAGIAPKPVKLGPRTSAWRVYDIQELIKNIEKEDWEKKTSEKLKKR